MKHNTQMRHKPHMNQKNQNEPSEPDEPDEQKLYRDLRNDSVL